MKLEQIQSVTIFSIDKREGREPKLYKCVNESKKKSAYGCGAPTAESINQRDEN